MDGLYREFGEQLRQRRKEAQLTQGQVAERVGLTRTSVTNIERGRQHIALHQLFLLASAVGVEPGDLLPDQKVALDELLPASALEALSDDEEGRMFAARVLGKTQPPSQPRRKEAAT